MLADCCHLRIDTTAAPAAVFPSAQACGGSDWRRLDYLAKGNGRQRSTHALLIAGLWDTLRSQCQDLALVSTVAIGLDRPGSDLDILCQHAKPVTLAARLGAQGWQGCAQDERVWVLEQTLRGSDGQAWPVELYITPAPIETRHGWRHLSLMAALLEHFGWEFYRAVLRLRLEQGLNFEDNLSP